MIRRITIAILKNILAKYFESQMLKQLLFAILCLSFAVKSNAQQTYPVKLSGALIPPHSLSLSDYANERSSDLMINATLSDPVEPFRDVYFRISVEHNGQEILATNPNYFPKPTRLFQLSTEMLDGSHLASYLSSSNLVGATGNVYNTLLPEGFNHICIQAYDYIKQVPISNKLCLFGNFMLNAVPMLQSPVCGIEMALPETQNLFFNWMPMHIGSGNAPPVVEYEFELVEVVPGIVNPNDGFDQALQIYSTTTLTPSLLYTEAEPLLENNKDYAWRVKAYDPNGSHVFQNDGYSKVCTFSYTNTPSENINQLQSRKCEVLVTDFGVVPFYQQLGGVELEQGDIVKMGFFDMKIEELIDLGGSYEGLGTVYVAFLKAHIGVRFTGMKIRPDKRVYAIESAEALVDPRCGVYQEPLSSYELDEKINDSFAKELNLFFYNTPLGKSQIVSRRSESDEREIGMPMALDNPNNPSAPPVYILGMKFTERKAFLTAFSAWKPAPNDKHLLFAGADIPCTAYGVSSEAHLPMFDNYYIDLKGEDKLTFYGKKSKTNNPTKLHFTCEGFENYQISGEYILMQQAYLPHQRIERVAFPFTANTTHILDFLGSTKDINKIHLSNLPEYSITLKDGTIDFSFTENPEVSLTDSFFQKKDKTAQGILYNKASVELPNTWSFIPKPKKGEHHLEGPLYFSQEGAYGHFVKTDLVSLEEGAIRDWKYSIDTLALLIEEGKKVSTSMKGTVKVPIIDDAFAYEAQLPDALDENPRFIVKVPTEESVKLGLWNAELLLDKSARLALVPRTINGQSKLLANADLNGELSLVIDNQTFKDYLQGDKNRQELRIQKALAVNENVSIHFDKLPIKGLKADPYIGYDNRYTLDTYGSESAKNSIRIGKENFPLGKLEILRQPMSEDGTEGDLGLLFSVSKGYNRVTIILWAKQNDKGAFELSNIEVDTKLLDCDCLDKETIEVQGKTGLILYDDITNAVASNQPNSFLDTQADGEIAGFPLYNLTNTSSELELSFLKKNNQPLRIKVSTVGENYNAVKETRGNANPSYLGVDQGVITVPNIDNYIIDNSFFEALDEQSALSENTVRTLPMDLTPYIDGFLPEYKNAIPEGGRLILLDLTVATNESAGKGTLLYTAPARDGWWFKFGASEVAMTPNAVGFKDLNLFLLEDYEETDERLPFFYERKLDNDPQEGSFVHFSCSGFEKYNVLGWYEFKGEYGKEEQKMFAPDTNSATDNYYLKLGAHFIIGGNNLKEFIAPLASFYSIEPKREANINVKKGESIEQLDRDKKQFKKVTKIIAHGSEGIILGIEEGGAFFDFSDENNHENHTETAPFRGLFFDHVNIMPEGMKYYKDTTNIDRKKRENLAIPARHFTFTPAQGLTGEYVYEKGKDEPDGWRGDFGGWNYGLTKFSYIIHDNKVTDRQLAGWMQMPIVVEGERINFSGDLGYDYDAGNPNVNLSIAESEVGKTFHLSLWDQVCMALATNEDYSTMGSTSSNIKLEWNGSYSEFDAVANFNGVLFYNYEDANNKSGSGTLKKSQTFNPKFYLPRLAFQNMKINDGDVANSCKVENMASEAGGLRSLKIGAFGFGGFNGQGVGTVNDGAQQYYANKKTGVASERDSESQKDGKLQGFPVMIQDVQFKCLQYTDADASKAITQKNIAEGKDKKVTVTAVRYKLDFELNINMMSSQATGNSDGGTTTKTSGIAGTTQLGFWGKANDRGDIEPDGFMLDAIVVNGKFSKASISGGLVFFNAAEDPVYGDGFKGYLQVIVGSQNTSRTVGEKPSEPKAGGSSSSTASAATGKNASSKSDSLEKTLGGAAKTAAINQGTNLAMGGGGGGSKKGFAISAMVQIGKTWYRHSDKQEIDRDNPDAAYRYLFIDVEGVSEKGISLKAVALHGLAGGFYYNMEYEIGSLGAMKVKSSKKKRQPPSVGSGTAVLSEGSDPEGYYLPGKSLSGAKYFPHRDHYGGYLSGIFSVANQPKVGAFDAGLRLELKKNNAGNIALSKVGVTGDLYIQAESMATRRSAPGKGHVEIIYDHVRRQLVGAGSLEYEYEVNDETNIHSTGTMELLAQFESPDYPELNENAGEWYFKIGKPWQGFTSSAKLMGMDMLGMEMYLQAGHKLDSLPPIETIIPEWNSTTPKGFGKPRSQEPTFGSGNGMIFGAKFRVPDNTYEYAMFKARIYAGMGFDLSLKQYKNSSISCSGETNLGTTSFGINNWYARGRAYAYARGTLDMNINLLFYNGWVNLFDVYASAVLQAELPNPAWMKGQIKGRFSVLNGKVSGNANFKWEMGERCTGLTTSPLAGVEVIGEVSPDGGSTEASSASEVAVYTQPAISFNIPVGKTLVLEDYVEDKESQDDGVMKEILREFKPTINKWTLEEKVGDSWSKIETTIEYAENGESAKLVYQKLLKAESTYKMVVEIGWNEFKNNVWIPIQLREDEKEVKTIYFETGGFPDKIPQEALAYQAPGHRQRYWHSGYAKPMLQFNLDGWEQLFQSSGQVTIPSADEEDLVEDVDWEYIARLTEYKPENGTTTERKFEFNLDEFPSDEQSFPSVRVVYQPVGNILLPYEKEVNTAGRLVKFSKMEDYIDYENCKGCMYGLEIIKRPVATEVSFNEVASIVKDSKTVQGDDDTENSNIDIHTSTLAGKDKIDLRKLGTDVIYQTYFAISKYDNLADKLKDATLQETVEGNATFGKGNKDRLGHPKENMLPVGAHDRWSFDVNTGSQFHLFKSAQEGYDKYDIQRLSLNMHYKPQVHPYEMVLYRKPFIEAKLQEYQGKNDKYYHLPDLPTQGELGQLGEGKAFYDSKSASHSLQNFFTFVRNSAKVGGGRYNNRKRYEYLGFPTAQVFDAYADLVYAIPYSEPNWIYQIHPNQNLKGELTEKEIRIKVLDESNNQAQFKNIEVGEKTVEASFALRNARERILEFQMEDARIWGLYAMGRFWADDVFTTPSANNADWENSLYYGSMPTITTNNKNAYWWNGDISGIENFYRSTNVPEITQDNSGISVTDTQEQIQFLAKYFGGPVPLEPDHSKELNHPRGAFHIPVLLEQLHKKGTSLYSFIYEHDNAQNQEAWNVMKGFTSLHNSYTQGLESLYSTLKLDMSFPEVAEWNRIDQKISKNDWAGLSSHSIIMSDGLKNKSTITTSVSSSALDNSTSINYAINSDSKPTLTFNELQGDIDLFVIVDIYGNKYYVQEGEEVDLYNIESNTSSNSKEKTARLGVNYNVSPIHSGQELNVNATMQYPYYLVAWRQGKYYLSELINPAEGGATGTMNRPQTGNELVHKFTHPVMGAPHPAGDLTFTKQLIRRDNIVDYIKLNSDGVVTFIKEGNESPRDIAVFEKDKSKRLFLKKIFNYSQYNLSEVDVAYTNYQGQEVPKTAFSVEKKKVDKIELERGKEYDLYIGLHFNNREGTSYDTKIPITVQDWRRGKVDVIEELLSGWENTDFTKDESSDSFGVAYLDSDKNGVNQIRFQYFNSELYAPENLKAVVVLDSDNNIQLYRGRNISYLGGADQPLNWNEIYQHQYTGYKRVQVEGGEDFMKYTGLPKSGEPIWHLPLGSSSPVKVVAITKSGATYVSTIDSSPQNRFRHAVKSDIDIKETRSFFLLKPHKGQLEYKVGSTKRNTTGVQSFSIYPKNQYKRLYYSNMESATKYSYTYTDNKDAFDFQKEVTEQINLTSSGEYDLYITFSDGSRNKITITGENWAKGVIHLEKRVNQSFEEPQDMWLDDSSIPAWVFMDKDGEYRLVLNKNTSIHQWQNNEHVAVKDTPEPKSILITTPSNTGEKLISFRHPAINGNLSQGSILGQYALKNTEGQPHQSMSFTLYPKKDFTMFKASLNQQGKGFSFFKREDYVDLNLSLSVFESGNFERISNSLDYFTHTKDGNFITYFKLGNQVIKSSHFYAWSKGVNDISDWERADDKASLYFTDNRDKIIAYIGESQELQLDYGDNSVFNGLYELGKGFFVYIFDANGELKLLKGGTGYQRSLWVGVTADGLVQGGRPENKTPIYKVEPTDVVIIQKPKGYFKLTDINKESYEPFNADDFTAGIAPEIQNLEEYFYIDVNKENPSLVHISWLHPYKPLEYISVLSDERLPVLELGNFSGFKVQTNFVLSSTNGETYTVNQNKYTFSGDQNRPVFFDIARSSDKNTTKEELGNMVIGNTVFDLLGTFKAVTKNNIYTANLNDLGNTSRLIVTSKAENTTTFDIPKHTESVDGSVVAYRNDKGALNFRYAKQHIENIWVTDLTGNKMLYYRSRSGGYNYDSDGNKTYTCDGMPSNGETLIEDNTVCDIYIQFSNGKYTKIRMDENLKIANMHSANMTSSDLPAIAKQTVITETPFYVDKDDNYLKASYSDGIGKLAIYIEGRTGRAVYWSDEGQFESGKPLLLIEKDKAYKLYMTLNGVKNTAYINQSFAESECNAIKVNGEDFADNMLELNAPFAFDANLKDVIIGEDYDVKYYKQNDNIYQYNQDVSIVPLSEAFENMYIPFTGSLASLMDIAQLANGKKINLSYASEDEFSEERKKVIADTRVYIPSYREEEPVVRFNTWLTPSGDILRYERKIDLIPQVIMNREGSDISISYNKPVKTIALLNGQGHRLYYYSAEKKIKQLYKKSGTATTVAVSEKIGNLFLALSPSGEANIANESNYKGTNSTVFVEMQDGTKLWGGLIPTTSTKKQSIVLGKLNKPFEEVFKPEKKLVFYKKDGWLCFDINDFGGDKIKEILIEKHEGDLYTRKENMAYRITPSAFYKYQNLYNDAIRIEQAVENSPSEFRIGFEESQYDNYTWKNGEGKLMKVEEVEGLLGFKLYFTTETGEKYSTYFRNEWLTEKGEAYYADIDIHPSDYQKPKQLKVLYTQGKTGDTENRFYLINNNSLEVKKLAVYKKDILNPNINSYSHIQNRLFWADFVEGKQITYDASGIETSVIPQTPISIQSAIELIKGISTKNIRYQIYIETVDGQFYQTDESFYFEYKVPKDEGFIPSQTETVYTQNILSTTAPLLNKLDEQYVDLFYDYNPNERNLLIKASFPVTHLAFTDKDGEVYYKGLSTSSVNDIILSENDKLYVKLENGEVYSAEYTYEKIKDFHIKLDKTSDYSPDLFEERAITFNGNSYLDYEEGRQATSYNSPHFTLMTSIKITEDIEEASVIKSMHFNKDYLKIKRIPSTSEYQIICGDKTATTTISKGTWYHITYVFDRNEKTETFYIDGTEAGKFTGEYAFGVGSFYNFIEDKMTRLKIGKGLKGQLDNLLLTEHLYTAEEVKSSLNGYNLHSNAIAYYNFDKFDGVNLEEVKDKTKGIRYHLKYKDYQVEDYVLALEDKEHYGESSAFLPGGAFTIEFWAKKNTSTKDMGLLSWKDGKNSIQWLNSDNVLRHKVNNFIIDVDAYDLSDWFHYAVTYDGNNRKVYINGALRGSDNIGEINNGDTEGLYVGMTLDLKHKFKGFMDNIRIWNKALSANEVRQNISRETIEDEANLRVDYDFKTRKDDFIWDIKASDHVMHILNTKNHESNLLLDASLNVIREGMEGSFADKYLDFGNEDKYGEVDIATLPSGNDAFTIGFWTKKETASNANQGILGWEDGKHVIQWVGAENTIRHYLDGSALDLDCSGQEGWYHYAVTYDGSTRNIYLNGELVKSDNVDGIDIPATQKLQIGKDYWTKTSYNGALDNLKIWNKALSNTEIENEIYLGVNAQSAGKDLVLHYSFDIANTNITDEVNGTEMSLHNINNTDFIPQTGLLEIKEKVKESLDWCVEFTKPNWSYIPSQVEVNNLPNGKEAFTIQMWLKPDGIVSSDIPTLLTWKSQQNKIQQIVYLDNNHNYHFFLRHNLEDKFIDVEYTELLKAKDWFLYTVTFDGTTRSIYLNGKLVSSDTPDISNQSIVQSSQLDIGQSYSGKLDKLQVWNKDLSENEIARGIADNTTLPTNGLILDYDFNTSDKSAIVDNIEGAKFEVQYENMIQLVLKDRKLDAIQKTVSDKLNRYLVFDNDQKVGTITADKLPKVNNAFTFEFWAKKTDVTSSDKEFISWGNGESTISFTQSDKIRHSFGNNPIDINATALSEWFHYAITYDGTTRNVYLNGELKNSDSPALPNIPSSTIMYLGNSQYHGFIDDLRVWDKALTTEEVRNSITDEVATNSPKLVLYYDFDKPNTDIIYDKVQNAEMTLEQCESSDFVLQLELAKIRNEVVENLQSKTEEERLRKQNEIANDKSLQLTTTYRSDSHPYLNISDVNSGNNGAYTIEFWAKPEFGFNATNMIGLLGWGTESSIYLKPPNNIIHLVGYQNSSQEIETIGKVSTIPANQWFHYAITYDGATRKIFLNGDLEFIDQPTKNIEVKSTLFLGRETYYPRRDIETYKGLIDNFRVWNRALSRGELRNSIVADKLSQIDGLVVNYDFDSPTNLTDRTGNSSVTLENQYDGGYNRQRDKSQVLFPNDNVFVKKKNALKNGSNKYIFFDKEGAYGELITDKLPSGNSPYTIEVALYFNEAEITDYKGVLGWGNTAPLQANALELLPGNIRHYWWAGDIDRSTIGLRGWHQYTFTYDGTTRKVYIDGELKGEDAPGRLDVPQQTTFFLGKALTNGYFKGGMDNVRVWNRALSQTEITTNVTTDAVSPDASGLILYYDFNQPNTQEQSDKVSGQKLKLHNVKLTDFTSF